MSGAVLILRPEPGASETAARAIRLGLKPVKAPLFTVRPLRWEAPDPSRFDAVLVTSANAARHGGEPLPRLARLPCFAVGEASAASARAAGFVDVVAGPSDGAAVAAMMAGAGVRRALHLCGRDHVAAETPGVSFERRIVYAAEPLPQLPAAAAEAMAAGALVLVHSPRAAGGLARLVTARGGIKLAAISAAAAEAAGAGWALKAVAPAPRDEALLELAAQLCNYGAPAKAEGGDGL